MQGTPEVTCSTSGEWQTLPSCESVTCGAAPDVTNADSNIITKTGATAYGAIVEYMCKAGYEIKGSSRRLCNATNVWSNTAPTCERIKCPLPEISMGSLSVEKPADFEDKVNLACEPGYWASTTNKTVAVLTCKADGRFEEVSCVDEDECVTKSPCLSTQTCVNNVGSHKCVCRQGYRPGTVVQCEDINECGDGSGGCQHSCKNSAGSYTCTCKDGYKLFENGTNSKYIVEGETGLRRLDVYHVNHSCVRNTCPRPSDVTNGVLHSEKQTFFYQDEIMYSCQLGFSLSGDETRTCQAPGTWSGSDPTCTAVSCSAQTRQGTDVQKERAVRIVPTTPVPFKGKVVIGCRKEDNSTFNKTLYCAYDSKTKTYTLQGDSPICPVVDCGPVEDIAGLNNPDLETTGSTFGTYFEFSCSTGATLSGVSTENSTTVRCRENGRWGFGNLTCKATKCPDPGTPGGSEQIFDSYEQGKVVAYRCTRPGFTPVPDDSRTCVYSDTAKSASWTGSVPVCEDTMPPVFANCDGDRNITIYKMQVPNITIPSVQDNSGFLSMKGFILPRGFNPADPVLRNTEVTYEATDGAGRSSQCKFHINVREMSSITLDCPHITYNVTSTTPTTYNIADQITHSSGALTSSPTTIVNLTNVGTFNDYRVTLRNDQGFEKTCTFQVLIKAGKCFHELTNSLQNADVNRSSNNDNSILSSVVTCKNGYALADGSTSRTYNCSGENFWSPSLPLEDCLPSSITEYTYKVSLHLKSRDLVNAASACRSDLAKLYNDVISPNASGINNLCPIQGQLNARYRFSVAEAIFVGVPALFDHKVELTLKLENYDGQNTGPELCAGNINLQKTVLFGLEPGDCAFTVQDSSTGVNLTRSGQSCSVGYQLRDVGGSKKCLPCPHGYSSSPSGDCVECPDGQYQDQPGQPSCKSCGSDMYSLTPRTSRARCVNKCRPGFYSTTGQQPCVECQEDTYWVNATHCLPCPDGGSTLYVEGTTSISACRAPCPSGQYSVTGYAPCTPCPRHFYQDSRAQTQCKECDTDQITEQTGSKTLSDCKPGKMSFMTLDCPHITYNVTSTTPTTYNIADQITHSSGALTSSPTTIVNLSNVGTFNDYRVTLRNDQGFEKTSGKCFHELTNSLQKADVNRSSNNGYSILSSVVTCKNGYALADGSTSRTYNCSGENLCLPHPVYMYICIFQLFVHFGTTASSPITEYTYKVSLDLKSRDLVNADSACRSDLTNLYNDVISPTTSGINNLCPIQGQLNARYRFSVAEAIFVGVPALFDHKVELTLKVENYDGQNTGLELCAGNINLQKTVLFGLVAGECSFTVQDSSPGVNLTRFGQPCSVGYQLRDVGGSKKCLPCPHGYSSSPSGGCVECPDGQYQDQPGQLSCKSCGSNMYSLTPRTSRARCVSKCRPGFYSETGQQPCDGCNEDTYWVNATHCLPCPDGGSTLYVEGTTSISACRAPCPSGQYSVTGYAPCTPCPRHFYQDSRAQTQCKECDLNQTTEQTGSKTLSDCKPGKMSFMTLDCPHITYNVTSTTPTTYNIADQITHSSGALTSSPTTIVNLSNVGTFNDYRVTLRNDQGFEKTCAFQVLIKAGKCFHELTNSLQKADVNRSSNNGYSILSSVVTCKNGYALADGSTSRTYNCSGENLWSPSLPLEDCLPSSHHRVHVQGQP
ncbi:sushi, von Willebrand factor type A, EGF and pentraxin domain-containing protein 1-like [Haliotis rubra]|uniref:sushi, von Willebrand factor type A, EGF and pentraxin domain-containing protein 1-like n=1 Tax=Haliotis rubra TaxID=36100 RepID=UPI001EE573EA|nr:sushi, von Willebrand factor type A, EGF and pentraxin domain-containing protein 1-like [Haliotis rubra]